MKAFKSGLAALTLGVALTAGFVGSSTAQDQGEVGKEWVCYYDRVTYELLYCQWE